MHKIEVDDVVYDHLVKNVQRLGEDASSILRRLLNLSTRQETGLTGKKIGSSFSVFERSVTECLQDSRFISERDAVSKFLFALSWLYRKHTSDFKKVLSVRGRTRQYFAESANALEEKGNSVNPQRIPGSPYWVITNNDTPKKQKMLMDVMKVLGYSSSEGSQLADGLE